MTLMTEFAAAPLEKLRLPLLDPWRSLPLLGLVLVTTGCTTSPASRATACGSGCAPPIAISPDGRSSTTTLSVLTYNIEGLGWPARGGRAKKLREIGVRLADMRASGSAPDVILFQEMFDGAAKKAVLAAGYPAIASGPHRTTPARQDVAMEALPDKARITTGEIGMHLAGSGLAIASRYPVTYVETRAYGSSACAGFDCLSNKGVLLARISIPGAPTPIDLYNTHMNSRRSSHAAKARHLAAHERQALQASMFIDQTHVPAYPLIFGGDFNMRRSKERWSNFSRYQSLSPVQKVCADVASRCDVRMSWDGDAPWMDTQDLQFYRSGDLVTARPIRIEAVFDGGERGPKLSDHDGLMVTYELKWPTATKVGGGADTCMGRRRTD